jgi:ABC-2 type transport system ATP-binding protein
MDRETEMHETPPLAELQAATRRYGDITAVDGIDLTLHRGEVLALLGANGAGKSTAIALMLGLVRADAGSARLFGMEPEAIEARRRTGVMLQSCVVSDMLHVDELLDLTRSYYPSPRSVADCVALAGLEGLLPRRYARLSGGQQRRVQFALAICGRPDLLFLDEPTTGLDIEARQGLWRALRELVAGGTSVLLTTHYIEEAEALADRVAVMAGGRIVASGPMDAMRARVSQRRIRCRSDLDVEVVAGWPGVREAARNGGQLDIVADAAEPVLRRLLAADDTVADLDVRRAGLADAFLEITRQPHPAHAKETFA